MKVVTIDCQYLFPRFAASYLITAGGHGVLVDNNTAHSVPLILKAMETEGLKHDDIDFLIVTHVHLDHAGGTSALIKLFPNAKVLSHPRAARHLIDPSKLVTSARQVYGDAEFEKLYGSIEPIEASRVKEVQDGEEISWKGIQFRFLYTRGHANHHICILISEMGKPQSIFTGDAFGLVYPDIQPAGGVFAFPSTSPTDFNADEARKSIVRIRDSGARVVYPTHFGAVEKIDVAAEQLLEEIDYSEMLLNQAITSNEYDEALTGFCERHLMKHFSELLARRQVSWDQQTKTMLKLDIELNAAGIAHVAKKLRSEKHES